MITIGTLRKTLRKHTKNRQKQSSINYEVKIFFGKLWIDDRVEKMQENETFITIKDHKEGFPLCLSCRLLNPSKTNIGKISKILIR